MEYLTILLISIALAMDAFAVSVSVGTCCMVTSRRGKIRLAAHFGIFQAGMTALGWVMGETIVGYVAQFDHWIAFGLLVYVGSNLLRAGLGKKEEAFEEDPSTGKTLVVLSVATSIDAFAVGLSIALLGIPVLFSVLSIGVVALLLSAVGLWMGRGLGDRFGRRMEVVGGLILLAIGIRIVVTHLVG